MDTTKWKSIAVRIEDYKLLRGLCKSKFRAPAGMISKLVHEYIEYQAKKNKVKVENYKKELMKRMQKATLPVLKRQYISLSNSAQLAVAVVVIHKV